jgi:hypothetical protein
LYALPCSRCACFSHTYDACVPMEGIRAEVHDCTCRRQRTHIRTSTLLQDCIGQSCAGLLQWIGDGFCDDGQYGIDFNCEAHSMDGGDCGSCARSCF